MLVHRQTDAFVSLPDQLTPSPPSITPKTNNQKLPGVRITKSGKFGAKITWKKKSIWVGSFNTPEEASAAVLLKKSELNRVKDLRTESARSSKFAGAPLTGNCGKKNRVIDLTQEPETVAFAGPSRTGDNGGKKREKIELTTERWKRRRNPRLSRKGNNSWGRPSGNPELFRGDSSSISKVVEQEIDTHSPRKKKPCVWQKRLVSNSTPNNRGGYKKKKKAAGPIRDPRSGKFVSGGNGMKIVVDSSESDDDDDDEEEEELSGGFGILNGVRVMDKNGFLVGEFSKIDDLSIGWDEDAG